MRFVRFKEKGDKIIEMKGIVEGGAIKRLHGSIFQGYNVSEEVYKLDEVTMLSPILPYNIMCMARQGMNDYVKSVTSIAGSETKVTIPKDKDVLFFIPRYCFVLQANNDKPFGVCLMLDFFLNLDNPGILSSSINYTLIGPSLWTEAPSDKIICEVGKKKLQYPIYNKGCEGYYKIAKALKLYNGDIMCHLLGEPLGCKREEEVKLYFDQSDDILKAYIV